MDGDDSPSERTAIAHSMRPVQNKQKSRWPYQRRYLVALLAFLGFSNVYALRVNLSVAIVSMTTNYTYVDDTGTQVARPAEFDWDPGTKGLVLSSFFYGYIATQIPAGHLAAKFGGCRLFGIGVAVTSALSILTPLFARGSLYLLLAARVAQGFFEGVTYPAIHAVWSRWSPPLERTKLATIGFSGSYFGTVLALPLSGLLDHYLGWPAIFVFFGLVGLMWSLAWWLLVAESPSTDKEITEHELDYIRGTLGSAANNVKVHLDVPWRRMLTSLPVWAIVIAHFSENWGFYTLLTELPTFMNDVYGFDMQKAGVLSALPYLAMGLMVLVGGTLADYFRTNGLLSTGMVRKVFNCGAFALQAAFLLAAAHASNPTNLILCLTAAVGFGGFAWAGFGVNHLDIAPPYASILMGISNTFATLPGMASPLVTGHLVANKSWGEWQAVFYIASLVYVAGAVLYGIFASGDEQSWARVNTGLLRDDESSGTDDQPYGEADCE